MSELINEIDHVYKIHPPSVQTIPFVFDSPHSGSYYPDNYDYSIELELLRRTEDRLVDDLYSFVPEMGAPLLEALFARNYIDVNRAIDDIDPDLLDADWPEPYTPSVRSAAGHGLIHRLVKAGSPIYGRRLTVMEIQHRIENYYRPYHSALKKLLDDTHYNFGQVWHINCHSMNSTASRIGTAFLQQEADFVLGDRDGTSCDPKFTRSVKDFLSSLGYQVYINTPYKGVELLQRYSNPQQGRNSLQVEISKALYLNEDTQEKSRRYNKLKADLQKMCQFMMSQIEQQQLPQAAD